MTSALDVIEMTREGDKYVPMLGHGGSTTGFNPATGTPLSPAALSDVTLTGPTSVVGGAAGLEEFVAELLGGGAGGGLSFADQLSLELQVQGLRNQGDLAVTGLSGQIQRQIAELQEAGETGRTRFTTEAQARAAAQQFANFITTGLGETLEAQGFVSPALAALAGRPSLARAALIEALREGTIFPTLGREQLLAQAAAEPSDIVRLLALSAGREPLAGAEQELQGKLAFNQPKLVEEGRSAQLRLAEQLEGLPDITFQDILDRLLPLVEEPEPGPSAVDIAGLISQAIAGIGGGGGGDGGGGDVLQRRTQEAQERLRTVSARENLQQPRRAPTAVSEEARARLRRQEARDSLPSNAQRAFDSFELAVSRGPTRSEREGHFSDFSRRIRSLGDSAFSRLRSQILGQRLGAGFAAFRSQLIDILDRERRRRTSSARERLAGRAEGGPVFDPGFFIVGEGGGGMKRGSAEFAFLAEGSVVAPMKKGEKPTMTNARRAVAEMILHGRRRKDGEPVKRLGHGGVTVVSGDNLWTIIQRLGGDPTRWPEVARAIGLTDPRRLQPGTLIPFEVLQRVGARVPAAPAPTPAPAPAPARAPAPTRATPAPTPATGPSPEEEKLGETIEGIETLLGPGGTVAEALRSGRSITEILQGFTLKPSRKEFRGLDIDPELKRRFFGPATQFPFQEFQRLPSATQQAISSIFGTVSGDKNLFGAILGLQPGLRTRAFSGNEQIALTR